MPRGRPTKEAALVKQVSPKKKKPSGKLTGVFTLPNLSGKHDAGMITKTPVLDTDIANKKYVDDEVDNKIEDGTATGQVAFWDGSKWVHTETSEFFWDDTNKRVGIGTASPNATLKVNNDSASGGIFSSTGATDYISSGSRTGNSFAYSAKTNIGGNASYRAVNIQISPGVTRDFAGALIGFYYQVFSDRAVTMNELAGTNGLVEAKAGTVTTASAVVGATGVSTTGNMTHSRTFWAKSPAVSGTGSIANMIGLHIDDHSAGTVTSYAIYTEGGKHYFKDEVGIGTASPSRLLHTYSDTTSTNANVLIEQDGTGDAAIGFLLSGGQGWSIGVDNTDDAFKIGASTLNVASGLALTITPGGDVDVIDNFTAGTIQADDGFTGSFRNAEDKTVTVVGGIITDVS